MSKRDLSTLDRDIGQEWSRIIQEAFAHGITNDLIFGGLEPGQTALQGLYEKSATKNCKLGTRRVTWDGRVFRYAKAGVTIGSMKRGVYGYNKLVAEKNGLVDATLISAKQINLTVVAQTYGVNSDGIIGADELVGGYISLYNSAGVRDQRLITGNTALAADETTFTISFSEGLSLACDALADIEILANPYSDVRSSETLQYGIYGSVLGMPNVLATEDDYFWIQTWGICRVTPTGAELGVKQGERMFVFGSNGSLYSARAFADGGAPADHSYQPGGFIIERTTGDAGSAAPFIMLQISP